MQRLDAISFFGLVLLLSAAVVRLVWNSLRKDIQWLPQLSYWRALGLVLVWGCLFIVVLTMISGARELMTPGAWERQGATYKLKTLTLAEVEAATDVRRRQRLEELRLDLWRYAAMHQGRFPSLDPKESPIPAAVWQLPDLPNQRFLYVPNQSASDQGKVLAYEPELGQPRRQVLLTDGSIIQLTSAEITSRTSSNTPRQD
jgi:hypothetical protein